MKTQFKHEEESESLGNVQKRQVVATPFCGGL